MPQSCRSVDQFGFGSWRSWSDNKTFQRSLRDNESGGTATPVEAAVEAEAAAVEAAAVVEAAAEAAAAEAAAVEAAAVEAAAVEAAAVEAAARVAPSAASCWRYSVWNC